MVLWQPAGGARKAGGPTRLELHTPCPVCGKSSSSTAVLDTHPSSSKHTAAFGRSCKLVVAMSGSVVASTFALAVGGGLAANFGLMRLNQMHKGCANVCTLCQFVYGLSTALLDPQKRSALHARQLCAWHHAVFAAMFFVGPYLGNTSVAITNADFYPVFLVVRSCGSASSLLLGLLAGRRYSARQVISVLVVTLGAGITTFGCFKAKQTGSAASTGASTPPHLFLAGLGLLLANLLNDAGLGVFQSWVFERHGKHVNESVFMMSAVGTVLMAIMAGPEVLAFLRAWVAAPTWASVLGVVLPWEFVLLAINFVGNWNAKKLQTWLNANSTAVISSLVPMLYRLLSTLISTQLNRNMVLPGYTWIGITVVFAGSLSYLLAPKVPDRRADDGSSAMKKAE